MKEEGTYEAVVAEVEKSGKPFLGELAKLYTSRIFQEAYLTSYPHHESAANVALNFREQYPPKGTGLTIDEMVMLIRRAIAPSAPDQLPCTLIVLDEVQQYINESAEIANDIREVIEAVQSMLDGRVVIAATGRHPGAATDHGALSRSSSHSPQGQRCRESGPQRSASQKVRAQGNHHQPDY